MKKLSLPPASDFSSDNDFKIRVIGCEIVCDVIILTMLFLVLFILLIMLFSDSSEANEGSNEALKAINIEQALNNYEMNHNVSIIVINQCVHQENNADLIGVNRKNTVSSFKKSGKSFWENMIASMRIIESFLTSPDIPKPIIVNISVGKYEAISPDNIIIISSSHGFDYGSGSEPSSDSDSGSVSGSVSDDDKPQLSPTDNSTSLPPSPCELLSEFWNAMCDLSLSDEILFCTSAGDYDYYYPSDFKGIDNIIIAYDNMSRSCDIIAPYAGVSTTLSLNENAAESKISRASSFVAATAALLAANYPNIKASEIKEAIINGSNDGFLDVEGAFDYASVLCYNTEEGGEVENKGGKGCECETFIEFISKYFEPDKIIRMMNYVFMNYLPQFGNKFIREIINVVQNFWFVLVEISDNYQNFSDQTEYSGCEILSSSTIIFEILLLTSVNSFLLLRQ